MNAEKQFNSWEDAVEWLRKQPDQLELVKAAYYDDPLLQSAHRYSQSEEWLAVRQLLDGREGQALDIGAGRGIASYSLARDGFQVTALEPDPSDIVGSGAIRQLANDSGLEINVVEKFSERLPFEDDSFDVIFARAVLHHMSDLEKSCSEVFRVLKPGGLFVAVREHVISKHDDLDDFLEQHPLHNLYGGENAFLLSEYTHALKKSGFKIRNTLSPFSSPINYFPYTYETLRVEMLARLSFTPLVRPIANWLFSKPVLFSGFLSLASIFDKRPGRLYSFICDKPRL